jgi:hypothetical protein
MNSVAVQTASRIVFEPTNHHYFVEGIRRPSVTEILRETGVSTDFDEIAGMSRERGDAIEFKRALGTALHSDIHAYDDGDLDWKTVDSRVRPYLEAWDVYRTNHPHLTPNARERRVWHPSMNYCGTLDGIFLRDDGNQVLFDVKTGDPHDAAANFQTAGYQLAYGCEFPEAPIVERCSIQLIPERRVPYVVTPYRDWNDFAYWQSFVTTYWQQAARRRRHV